MSVYFNPILGIYPTITTVDNSPDELHSLFASLTDAANFYDGVNVMRLENSDSNYPIEVWYPRIVASFPVFSSYGLTNPPLWTGKYKLQSV